MVALMVRVRSLARVGQLSLIVTMVELVLLVLMAYVVHCTSDLAHDAPEWADAQCEDENQRPHRRSA